MGNSAQDTVRKRRRAFLGATSGHLIEWYDYGVYGFLAVYIGQAFFVSDDPTTSLLASFAAFALSFFIRPLGGLFFGPLASMTDRDFNQGLQDKLLGQIRLALTGQHYLNEGGSITLISGIVAHEPIAQGVNATTVNAGLEGFVRAAACELPRGIRINLISPTVLTESLAAYDGFFPGFASVPAAAVAQAYRRSVEGIQSGRVYTVGY